VQSNKETGFAVRQTAVAAITKRDGMVANRMGIDMPAHRIGNVAMTAAERQARHRSKRCQATLARPTASNPRPLPRPRRWAAAVATLVALQDEYCTWRDNLPANLEGSRLAEKLDAVVELDFTELLAIDPPLGYGRD
jgi:hypothetical protein